MICYKCGAPVPDGASACAVCGTPLKGAENSKPEEKEENEINKSDIMSKPPEKNANKLVIAVIAAAAFISATAICSALCFMPHGREEKAPIPQKDVDLVGSGFFDEEPPVSTRRAEKKEAPDEPAENSSEENTENASEGVLPDASDAPEWLTTVYEGLEIECAVPRNFVYKSELSSVQQAVYFSPDGTVMINIAKFANEKHLQPTDCKNEFVSTMDAAGRSTVFSEAGDTYYRVEIESGDSFMYRKCFVDSDFVRLFEFSGPLEYRDYYMDHYVDYIEKSFNAVRVPPEAATELE